MKVRTFIFATNLISLSEPISITSIASISSLGFSLEDAWQAYQTQDHYFIQKEINGDLEWVAQLSEKAQQEINILRQSDAKYNMLDNSVLYAIYVSRKAIKNTDWTSENNFGINIGSSRGATSLFEKYHSNFLENKSTSSLSSPTTTLGNISSWVAHDLQTKGPEISHSITCSTALHSLLNGVAWLKSGMANKFLVGGSEAPLTPFTIAQMKALKIYAKTSASLSFQNETKKVASASLSYHKEENKNKAAKIVEPNQTTRVAEHSHPQKAKVAERSRSYPCQALNLTKKQNSMILGEGASVACLEKGISSKTLAVLEGVGYATEMLEHNVSISADAKCFQRSMKMALGNVNPNDVDVVVMHAPGTIKGDIAEYRAIEKVFCNKIPFLTTNKSRLGHTFGASGMLSVEMAVLMLLHQRVITLPYLAEVKKPSQIRKVLVNAVGFGGNAVSVLLSV